jgi:hypothetical protein
MKCRFPRLGLSSTVAFLLIAVLITTTATAGLYARYTVTAEGTDAARVAQFVFSLQAEGASFGKTLSTKEIRYPGDTVEYYFAVSNAEGGSVCEVAQDYTVEVRLGGNMPLAITLERLEGSANGVGLATPSPEVSLGGELNAAEEQIDHYKLTVTWPLDQNDPAYANGAALSQINLTVTSQQKD